jgi:hypothetical protein
MPISNMTTVGRIPGNYKKQLLELRVFNREDAFYASDLKVVKDAVAAPGAQASQAAVVNTKAFFDFSASQGFHQFR